MKQKAAELRRQLFNMIEIGYVGDTLSRSYDYIYVTAVLLNIAVSILYTYETLRALCGTLLLAIEGITLLFFVADFILRCVTAEYLYPGQNRVKAAFRYVTSITGIIDLLSFLPYYIPFFFPAGAAAFRMFRVVRILRLFRINAYYDSFNVITEVLASKSQQLISSVFIILVLMVASSLCMYSIEHEAQPEIFTNAFSGIWWSASTLLTVGYGDIYPITTTGKFFGIVIAFLGVGLVAIPTGIISAGFVEYSARITKESEVGREDEVQYLKVKLLAGDPWIGCTTGGLSLPKGIVAGIILRKNEVLLPHRNSVLEEGDTIILAAEGFDDERGRIVLQESELKKRNLWTGRKIRELDISRHSWIVMVCRNGRMLPPEGDLILKEGDRVMLYSRKHLDDTARHEV